MPNIKSAAKRMRQNEKRRLRNRVYRGSARTYIKKARLAIEAGKLEEAQEASKLAIQALDRAAQKGVVHKNNAARRKSRLLQQLASLESKQKK